MIWFLIRLFIFLMCVRIFLLIIVNWFVICWILLSKWLEIKIEVLFVVKLWISVLNLVIFCGLSLFVGLFKISKVGLWIKVCVIFKCWCILREYVFIFWLIVLVSFISLMILWMCLLVMFFWFICVNCFKFVYLDIYI